MNCGLTASETEEASQQARTKGSTEDLHDAMHGMAQPLTALSFMLELGRMQDDPGVWRSTLNDALAECGRAVRSLEVMRKAVEALDRSEDWSQ